MRGLEGACCQAMVLVAFVLATADGSGQGCGQCVCPLCSRPSQRQGAALKGHPAALTQDTGVQRLNSGEPPCARFGSTYSKNQVSHLTASYPGAPSAAGRRLSQALTSRGLQGRLLFFCFCREGDWTGLGTTFGDTSQLGQMVQ